MEFLSPIERYSSSHLRHSSEWTSLVFMLAKSCLRGQNSVKIVLLFCAVLHFPWSYLGFLNRDLFKATRPYLSQFLYQETGENNRTERLQAAWIRLA